MRRPLGTRGTERRGTRPGDAMRRQARRTGRTNQIVFSSRRRHWASRVFAVETCSPVSLPCVCACLSRSVSKRASPSSPRVTLQQIVGAQFPVSKGRGSVRFGGCGPARSGCGAVQRLRRRCVAFPAASCRSGGALRVGGRQPVRMGPAALPPKPPAPPAPVRGPRPKKSPAQPKPSEGRSYAIAALRISF